MVIRALRIELDRRRRLPSGDQVGKTPSSTIREREVSEAVALARAAPAQLCQKSATLWAR